MSKRPLVIDGGVTKELPAGVPLTVELAVDNTDALARGQLLDGSFSPVVNALSAQGKLTQTPGAGANNSTPLAQYSDLFSDAIVSGLTTATITTLTGTLAAGVAYVLGQRVVYVGGTYTAAASSTSYLDLSNTGVVTVTTSITVTANSLRLWSVTSDASAITSVAQIAKSGIVLSAPIISPIFTGTPTSPTAVADTNTTQIATTAFVEAATTPLQLLADIKTVDGAGSGLDADLLDGYQLSQIQNGSTTYALGTGTANAITVALSPATTALTAGMMVNFTAAASNTGATTINVNGLGAKSLFGANAELAGGEIVVGGEYSAIYDGMQFNLIGSGAGSLPVGNATKPYHAVQLQQTYAFASPHDVTTTKTYNTTYTNTFGRPMWVCIFTSGTGSSGDLVAFINGVFAAQHSNVATGLTIAVSFLVPANATYYVAPVNSPANISSWNEFY